MNIWHSLVPIVGKPFIMLGGQFIMFFVMHLKLLNGEEKHLILMQSH